MRLEIKILGPGCPKCKMLKRHTQKAVEMLSRDVPDVMVTIEAVTDFDAILHYDVLSSPALVINEQVAATGKMLHTEEVLALLRAALLKNTDE